MKVCAKPGWAMAHLANLGEQAAKRWVEDGRDKLERDIKRHRGALSLQTHKAHNIMGSKQRKGHATP